MEYPDEFVLETMKKLEYDAVYFGSNEIDRRESHQGKHFEENKVKEKLHSVIIDTFLTIFRRGSFTLACVYLNQQKLTAEFDSSSIDSLKSAYENIIAASEKSNLNILILRGKAATGKKLLERCNTIDILVLAGCPLAKAAERIGQGILVYTGQKGLYLPKLNYSISGGEISADSLQLLEITPDLPEAKWAARQISHFQKQPPDIKYSIGVDASKTRLSRNFIGSSHCQSCHPQEYEGWKKGKHSQAFALLDLQKEHGKKDCLNCHALAIWEGFTSKPVILPGVQCESCHGPGLKHAEEGAPPPQIGSWTRCLHCHEANSGVEEAFEIIAKSEH